MKQGSKGGKMPQDETLVCKDCGKEFVFTVREQEFYAEKGFENKPQRCKECRIAKKNARNDRGPRQEYPIVCKTCGKEATLTFPPREGEEYDCYDCFKAAKAAE